MRGKYVITHCLCDILNLLTKLIIQNYLSANVKNGSSRVVCTDEQVAIYTLEPFSMNGLKTVIHQTTKSEQLELEHLL